MISFYDCKSWLPQDLLDTVSDWRSKCDCGIISAYRKYDTSLFDIKKKDPSLFTYILNLLQTDDKALTEKQLTEKNYYLNLHSRKPEVNERNSKLLEKRLRALSYSVIHMISSYTDKSTGKTVTDVSFLVFSIWKYNHYRDESKMSECFRYKYPDLFEDLIETGRAFEQDVVSFAPVGEEFKTYNCSPYTGQKKGSVVVSEPPQLIDYKGIKAYPLDSGCGYFTDGYNFDFRIHLVEKAKRLKAENNANYKAKVGHGEL